MAAFSYRVLFRSTTLCFGIQAGFKYMDIIWSKLNPKDPDDLELTGQAGNKAVPDADFGVYYYGSRFYAGISAKHLIQNEIIVSSAPPGGTTSFTKLLRNYYAMGGGVIQVSENLVFLPSLLVKYVKNAPLQADFTGAFQIGKIVTLGASYRTSSALGLIAGISIGKGLSFGYSYDLWFNSLKSYNSGSHEIRISYEIDPFNKTRLLTPRYF
jgi:type IX secretion system PorP/SprF family membrane protein